MLNDAKDDEGNEITVGGHPFDDLALSELLNKIVDKYDYAVDEYLAIKYMIDSQFEITYTFVKRQAILYLIFFFIPMLLQIFYLDNNPEYVLYCNHSCLFISILFLGVEFIQLD